MKGHRAAGMHGVAGMVIVLLLMMFGTVSSVVAQTAPNTVITNQARAAYQYRSLPGDTVRSNIVQFTVLDAPNFEVAFANEDTATFGKDTVTLRIVYTNIGNRTADSVTIQGSLPLSGVRFVPGSTSGEISGRDVVWRVFNIAAGRSDSVRVKVVFDSTLLMNTQLQMAAELSWQNSAVSAQKTFVIAAFPKLTVNINPSVPFVGSGRTAAYALVITNTGNTPATNTVVYDTIGQYGTFVSSSIAPDSLNASKTLVKWNIGTVPAFSTRVLTLSVATEPNLGHQQLTSSVKVLAANVPAGAQERSEMPILPVRPKRITIETAPPFIFGQRDKDSAVVTISVLDSTGQTLPDGTPLNASASLGLFSNRSSATTTQLKQGSARVILRSADVDNDVMPSVVSVIAGLPEIGTAKDSAVILMYPGAVTGVVVNGVNRVPFQGAVARVFNSLNTIIGADTTGADGTFFIPLSKDVSKYRMEIIVVDKFGDTIRTGSDIDPSRFPLPPILIPNIISGRIEYMVTGQPVPAENVTVHLDSIGAAPAARLGRSGRNRTASRPASMVRVRESITDVNGKFKFEELRPANYVISLDSTEFPNFKGFTFLTDTASGTFTINLSLQIALDTAVQVAVNAPPQRNAGDTVDVAVVVKNTGTISHRSVTVTDTLSAFSAFLSAAKGNFLSVTYDSLSRTVRWQRDSLRPLEEDSLHLRYVIARNVPDRTTLQNRLWFRSDLRSTATVSPTIVRSAAAVVFENRFVVPQDTIIAGDSILHVMTFRNIGTDSLRNVRIIDTLFSAGTVQISLAKAAHDSLQIVDSITTVFIGAIPPGGGDSVLLKLVTDFALQRGTSVASHAYLLEGDSILVKRDTLFTVAEHPKLPSFITISKTGNKKVGEIGDIVTYQVQINNQSPQPFTGIGLHDLLPYAFRYVKRSGRFNGQPSEPVLNPSLNQLSWTIADTIPAMKSATLVYQLAIGADALESDGVNTAVASVVTANGSTLVSEPSSWQVTVRPGVFSEKGLVIGKVFYDDDRNTFQDAGENGVKGIELWMEDGTKVITGDDGKFSLPEVKPGQHVLRVNERTLPPQTSLLPGNNAFALDPTSRFVRVTEGGIAKANFYLRRALTDTIVQSLAKVNKVTAVRQLVPKYLFEDTLRSLRVDTAEIVVSFVYSGNRPVMSAEILDHVDHRLRYVPNSATFNGKRINPLQSERGTVWRTGPSGSSVSGMLRYRTVLDTMPPPRTRLLSSSVVTVTAVDSIVVSTGTILTESEVVDTMFNRIETSEVVSSTSDPRTTNHLSDSVMLQPGDEVYFKTSLFVDPRRSIVEAMLIDTLPSAFVINERSVSVNGVPVPTRNLSVRMRSMALSSSARRPAAAEPLEFIRIASMDVGGLLRQGRNEITYSARLQTVKKDTVFNKHSFVRMTDDRADTVLMSSKDARIIVRTSAPDRELTLETVYINPPRSSVKIEEKVADAVKLVESLRSGSDAPVVMEGITFELSKATLTAESKIVLENIASILNANPDIRIQINGYTDNTGNAAANRKMSLLRAKEVAHFLVSKGINPDRLLPQGFGPAKPIASNKTEEGRAKNRRVEFAPFQ